MEALVNINGPLVEQIIYDPETGAPTEWPVTTLDMVQDQLRYQMPYDSVRVVINSPGGVAPVGLGVYDLLRAQPVQVTTEALGQCSSIATVIFLAGQRRRIYPSTAFMIHNPWGGIQGPMQSIQTYAQDIADLQARMLAIYVERTGADEAVLNGMMLEETTIDPQQVLGLGFATEIVQPVLAQARLGIKPTPTQAGAIPATTPQMTVVRQIPAGATAPGQPAPVVVAPAAAGTTTTTGAAAPAQPAAPAQGQQPNANPLALPKTSLAGRAWAKMQALFKRGPVKALATTTDAGDALTIDTGDGDTIAVGQAVYDANGAAVADATYKLEDGTTITTVGGVITEVTAPSTAQAFVMPTTLEAAQAMITQMQASAAAAPAAQAAAAPTAAAAPAAPAQPAAAVAPGAPAVVLTPTAQANPNADQMAALFMQFGSHVQSGGTTPTAQDNGNNPSLAHRGAAAGASKVADANSTDAKKAALGQIQRRNGYAAKQ